MLAYMRLILREAQKYKEGMGWLTYDSVFRQNNQGTARWDTLYPSLHMAFIGCQGVPATPPCRHCRGVDHIAANCALSPLIPPVHPGNVQQSAASTGDRKMRQIQQRQMGGFICWSWNWGKCRFPGNCYYKHICAVCGESHMAKECQRQTPDDARRLQAQRGDGWH